MRPLALVFLGSVAWAESDAGIIPSEIVGACSVGRLVGVSGDADGTRYALDIPEADDQGPIDAARLFLGFEGVEPESFAVEELEYRIGEGPWTGGFGLSTPCVAEPCADPSFEVQVSMPAGGRPDDFAEISVRRVGGADVSETLEALCADLVFALEAPPGFDEEEGDDGCATGSGPGWGLWLLLLGLRPRSRR